MPNSIQRHLDRMRRILKAFSLGAAIGIISAVTANSQGWATVCSMMLATAICLDLAMFLKTKVKPCKSDKGKKSTLLE